MVAIVRAVPGQGPEWSKELHVAAGAPHRVHVLAGNAEGAKRVEEHVDADTGLGRGRVHDLLA